MEKLKAAIIGTGGISRCHMDGYLQLSDTVEVVACCDIDREKVIRYAEEYNIAHWYTDCREMLAAEKPDCVSVTTWNAAHKDCTVAALDAGAHVICEKPMAMNAAEAQEMLDAAKRNGKILQVGFVRRFGDDAETVLDFARNGTLGDIYYAKAQYLRRSGCPGGWFRDKRFSGGGPLIDLGVHIIDLTRYLAGCPKPVSAYGVTFSNLGPNRAAGGESAWNVPDAEEHPYNVEDFASALVRFDNGFTLQLETSFNLNIASDSGLISLYGTKAGIDMDTMTLHTDTAGHFVEVTPTGRHCFDFSKSFQAEIKGFIDACTGKCECKAPAEDGLALMQIIDAIYESARTGKSVDIL